MAATKKSADESALVMHDEGTSLCMKYLNL